jgi:hypothetical protein
MNVQRTVRTLLGTGVVAAVLTLAPAAGATAVYSDAAGDSGTAVDLKGVTVTSDAAGRVVFRIDAPGVADGDNWLLVALDTDMNPLSGDVGMLGADYAFEVDAGGYGFGRWTGSAWEKAPYSTVSVFGGSGITIVVNRSELGNTNEFDFWVRSGKGDAGPGAYDDAPDDGTYNYSLAVGGVDIRDVVVQTVPAAGPHAGKSFTLSATGVAVGNDASTVEPDSYTCTAVLGGRKVVGSGTGRCTFRIPKKARGKRLVVTVTAVYEGTAKATRLVFKVR